MTDLEVYKGTAPLLSPPLLSPRCFKAYSTQMSMFYHHNISAHNFRHFLRLTQLVALNLPTYIPR